MSVPESIESATNGGETPETALLCAVLFGAGTTVDFEKLEEFFGWSEDEFEERLEEARKLLLPAGLTLIEVAGGWRMVTVPGLYGELDRFFKRVKKASLSKAALEVVSIIVYRQPCTRADVEEVRGVSCDGVIRGLLEKRLIKVKGRADAPGRPFSYVTSERFLEIFGMTSLSDLPRVDLVEQEG